MYFDGKLYQRLNAFTFRPLISTVWLPKISEERCELIGVWEEGGVLAFPLSFTFFTTKINKKYTFVVYEVCHLNLLTFYSISWCFLVRFWLRDCFFQIEIKNSFRFHISFRFERMHFVLEKRALVVGVKEMRLRSNIGFPWHNFRFIFEVYIFRNDSF